MLGLLEIFVLVGIILVPSFLVASYAKQKGYSYPLFLVLGLVFVTWPIALIVAAVLKDKTKPQPALKKGQAGPGWYPDPQNASYEWYWDGERWTEHREVPFAGGTSPASGP